jgi:hypothetical protein
MSSTVLQFAPLAECAKNKDRHDRGSTRRDDRADEEAESERCSALTCALDVDEAVANEAAREATEYDGGVGGDSRAARGKG